MKRFIFAGLVLTLAAAFAVMGGGRALAHGGPGLTLDPMQAKPGDTVTVHADAIADPNGSVSIQLAGPTGSVDLATGQAGDDGDYDGQFTVPMDLGAGTYEVEAIGKVTETAELEVLASGSEVSTTPAPTIQPRERPLVETIGLVALFGVLAGLGLLIARTVRPAPKA